MMKKRNLISFLLFVLLLTVPSRFIMAQELRPKFRSQVVVVQFEVGITIGEGTAKTNLAKFDRTGAKYAVYRIERVFPFLDYVEPTPRTAKNLFALRRTYYVRYAAQAVPEQVSRELSLSSGVVYAEPVPVNRIYRSVVRADPNDTKYQQQTYLKHMRFPEAWDIIKAEDASEPIVIAVVDNGADWRHEDLLTNVWTNEDEIAGNGIDDDRNGFIDDVHGVNLGNGDTTNNDPSAPTTGNTHGTATSSVAGAVTNNATGIAGAAWNAKLMHINAICQVGEEFGEICGGYEGIVYAAVNGADIINASWGMFGDKRLRMINQSLDFATDHGALVVAAAGNRGINADTGLGYPQAHPRVLSVGATERDSRKRAIFSQYGKTVDVFAPGENILTASTLEDKYHTETGTSFSAPLVAGVAALIKARFPEISPDSLREQLRLSSESIDTENPSHAGYLGRGYVNAEASLQPPTLPAVRVKHWSWKDDDGDNQIDPGDEVTITATVINYLVDAQQLTLELIEAEDYPYIMMAEAEQLVGFLGGGDSTEVTFRFSVSEDVPPSRKPRFYVRIRDGAFTDVADAFQFFGINQQMPLLHAAFKALYLSTDGENWKDKSGWDINAVPTAEEIADWHGVITVRGQVDGLDLTLNNLNGSLPSELNQAQGLRILELSGNSISGSIPPELGQLSNLERLGLSENSLSGPLPPELGQLSNLKRLDLYGNSLNGKIPREFGRLSNLELLNLGENSLSGSIPSELGQLSNLKRLDLYYTSLGGQIPSELGQLSNLEILSLGSNAFSGSIPPELGQLSELTLLDLSGNTLTGRLPRSFLQLKKLVNFDFRGEDLCAPEDDEFQAWLKTIPWVNGSTCGVSTAISTEDKSLPESFAALGNYPNPFRQTTHLMFDLPRESRVRVEVTDMIGRHVLTVPGHTVKAGWGKSVELNGRSLPAGFYLYRLIADSPSERSVQVGRFVRIK